MNRSGLGSLAAVAVAAVLGVAIAAVAGCGSTVMHVSNDSDMAVSVPPTDDGGTSPIFAGIAFAGCPTTPGGGGQPLCRGPAPLSVTLVPLSPAGTTSFLWTLPGADRANSKSPSPTPVYLLPGHYAITLVVGGPGGAAQAQAAVEVIAAPTGARCTVDKQCGAGARCVCGGEIPDGGVPCAGELANGLCTRGCVGGGCGAGELCVDLSRSAAQDPRARSDAWRASLCLPGCVADGDCRGGLHCLELPALDAGAAAGGAFSWRKACFAATLAAVGEGCIDANGAPDPTRCVGGLCLGLGARDVCTSPCGAGGGAVCPASAACGSFANDPTHPVCLLRCDAQHACRDPLLACQPADPSGPSGFTVVNADPPGTTYCTPRRCVAAGDCAPAGRCDVPDGGAAFCRP